MEVASGGMVEEKERVSTRRLLHARAGAGLDPRKVVLAAFRDQPSACSWHARARLPCVMHAVCFRLARERVTA